MGKPTLNDFTDDSYTRGADVYANDGAILCEVLGNCEPKINIAKSRSYRVVNGMGKLVAAADVSQIIFGHVTPCSTRLVNFAVIAAAKEATSNAGFYDTGHSWSGSAIVANRCRVWLQILDPNGNRIGAQGQSTQSVTGSRVDHIDLFSSGGIYMPTGSVVTVYADRLGGCNADFLPIIAANLTFLEEHV